MASESKEDSGFTLISAKEQQKRDSIMNELYNDMSSSDDEEEENSTANSEKTNQSAKAATPNKGTSTGNSNSAAEEGGIVNPFKRQVTAAESEALKELYGEDYEEPIGFEATESSEQKGRLAEKLSAKLTDWFGRAKGKYAEEMKNPESKVS